MQNFVIESIACCKFATCSVSVVNSRISRIMLDIPDLTILPEAVGTDSLESRESLKIHRVVAPNSLNKATDSPNRPL